MGNPCFIPANFSSTGRVQVSGRWRKFPEAFNIFPEGCNHCRAMDLQKNATGDGNPSRFQVGFLSEQQKKYRWLFEAWSLALGMPCSSPWLRVMENPALYLYCFFRRYGNDVLLGLKTPFFFDWFWGPKLGEPRFFFFEFSPPITYLGKISNLTNFFWDVWRNATK